MWYIYILYSFKNRRTYVGSTNNLRRRIDDHNNGKNRSTKHRIPFKLIYNESFNSENQARLREKYLKTRQGRNEMRELLAHIQLD